MTTISARRARLSSGWASDVTITLDGQYIASVAPGVGGAVTVDTLLPALPNLHSHSFQRAMAGMTERREKARDSFWTWRELMYRFLDRLNPDQIQAIAELAFVEMLEAGFASVGEFHYVHHQPGGARYENRAETSVRIANAAEETGIGLTLLPVLYRFAGADQSPVAGGALRFVNDPDEFASLMDSARTAVNSLPPDARLGVAPHSLRAVGVEDLRALPRFGGVRTHLHIAEQTREVDEIVGAFGARPVEHLLNEVEVDETWCLIHATHMTSAEIDGLAKTGAVAGLCPITEANLGDGIYEGSRWLASGGAFGVGSDSNVRISMAEELRTLEYSQRLRDRARNVLTEEGSVGAALYLGASKGGAQALDRNAGEIREGALADLVAIDARHPSLIALEGDQIMDGLVFAAPDGIATDVWSAGRHMVRDGRHIARDAVRMRYAAAIKSLVDD